MSNYRRHRLEGGSYFFTVNLRDRRSGLLTAEIAALRQAVQATRRERPFRIEAWVVLPDHLHCVWTLPAGDADFPARWQAIKARFSRRVKTAAPVRESLLRKRDAGVWQRRYWEHAIRDERDFAAHVDYVHFNPVKHGLVETAAAWPYSTFRRWVREGGYPEVWGEDWEFGERR